MPPKLHLTPRMRQNRVGSYTYCQPERTERSGATFEGIFRQHMVIKGGNRDTAWYAMIDKGWTALRQAYDA